MRCNLAETICRKHGDAIFRIAVEEVRGSGSNTFTFGGLDYLSDKFATALCDCGIQEGEVVAVALPPSAAFVVAHFAALKLGTIVAPLSIEIETVSLERLIRTSRARAIIIDEKTFHKSEILLRDLNDVELFIASDYVSKDHFGEKGKGFWYEINFADADFKITETNETTPAYIFFEQEETNIFTTTIYTHGIIVESLRKNEKRNHHFDCNEDTPVETTNEWAVKNMLLDLLYPAWFSGSSVKAGVVVK